MMKTKIFFIKDWILLKHQSVLGQSTGKQSMPVPFCRNKEGKVSGKNKSRSRKTPKNNKSRKTTKNVRNWKGFPRARGGKSQKHGETSVSSISMVKEGSQLTLGLF